MVEKTVKQHNLWRGRKLWWHLLNVSNRTHAYSTRCWQFHSVMTLEGACFIVIPTAASGSLLIGTKLMIECTESKRCTGSIIDVCIIINAIIMRLSLCTDRIVESLWCGRPFSPSSLYQHFVRFHRFPKALQIVFSQLGPLTDSVSGKWLSVPITLTTISVTCHHHIRCFASQPSLHI